MFSQKLIIVLFCFFFCLSVYVWIHHQTLLELENKQSNLTTEQMNHLNFLENNLETKIQDIEKQLKEKMITIENPKPESVPLQTPIITNPLHNLFQPSNLDKFPSFKDLIGFKEEKEAMEDFLDYLKNTKDYEGIGKVEPPLGILMYGMPGTGKTTLARAIAKESHLPFFEVSSSLFSKKFKGEAPQMVKDLFKTARQAAEKNNGAIIFLDECDTIFADLSKINAGAELANVVNQFKTELTSLDNNQKKPIFIIGATNHEKNIDEAIKSRFTYNIEIKPGTKVERKEMLEFLIKKRNNPYSEEAKQYLYEVINEALERLPQEKAYLKSNRTLENFLQTTITTFVKNKRLEGNERTLINKEDLKQTYRKLIDTDTSILDEIKKNLKN